MKVIRLYTILVFVLFLNKICHAENGPIVSPIGSNSVIAGGAINIFFSAVGPEITFSSDDLPSFAQLDVQEDNSGVIAINTNQGDEGSYLFHLQANGPTGITNKTIKLEVTPIPTESTVYYCDPINGDISNPGDSLNPWGSLESVFAAFKKFKPGDVIFCRDGLHGNVQVFGEHIGGFVTIAAQSGHQPTLQKILINGKRWVVSGMDISPKNAGITSKEDYVVLGRSANKVWLENCKIYGIDDANVWQSNEDWYANAGDGIEHLGKECIVRNNYIKNTNFSITIQESNNRFEYNTIDRFGGDAIRGLADDLTIAYNVIKNAVVDDYSDPGGNHDDAFQSWTFGEPKKNIRIQGNQVFNYTDPTIPLLSSIMQGIVCFDGFTEDWVVENNLVVNDHPHGIALYGTKNCKVVNNTIVRNPYQLFDFESEPWIDIHSHKDGRRSTGNLVRNNIMATFVFSRDPGTADHNSIGKAPTEIFVDYENWDFHLKEDAEEIDAGTKEDAPTIDNEGLIREFENTEKENPIDLGCFETNTTLLDLETPTAPTSLMVTNASNSMLAFTWNAATDNVGIAYYKVLINTIAFQTLTPSYTAKGLTANTRYKIEIRAIDFSGNESLPLKENQNTTEIQGTTYPVLMPIHPKDQQIESNNTLHWVGSEEHYIGGTFGENNGVAVLPFQLPIIPDGMEIKSANLNIHHTGKENMPVGNVAIYGLPFQNTADVSRNSYWQGASPEDEMGGILVVDNFIQSTTETRFHSLDSVATQKFANYINQQIMAGANSGDYLLLRMNSNIANEIENAFYKFSSADAENAALRPYVSYTIGEISTSLENPDITNSPITVYPNPVALHQALTLKSEGNQNVEVRISNLNGQLLWHKNVETFDNGSVQLATQNIFQEAGVYLLEMRTGEEIFNGKIMVF